MLQNATPLRKSAPGPRKMHLCRSSSNVPRLPSFLEMLQNPHVLLTFDKVHNPLRLPRERTSKPPKVIQTCGVLNILTSKCASRNFQKWSVRGVSCTFWLRNVLRATTACNCSSLICPAGSAPTALASLLFDPPQPNHWKNSVSRLSYLFGHLDLLSSETFSSLIFFLLLFSSLTLPISAFHLSMLSEVWLLNFLRSSTS